MGGGGGGSGRDSTQELSVLFLQPPGREGLFQNKSKKKKKLSYQTTLKEIQ